MRPWVSPVKNPKAFFDPLLAAGGSGVQRPVDGLQQVDRLDGLGQQGGGGAELRPALGEGFVQQGRLRTMTEGRPRETGNRLTAASSWNPSMPGISRSVIRRS